MAITTLKIVIAEPSSIVRSGLESVLKRLAGFRMQIAEVSGTAFLPDAIRVNKPDILFANPILIDASTIAKLKGEYDVPAMKCVALLYAIVEHSRLRLFDEQITIYDSADEIKRKLELLNVKEIAATQETEEQQMLSAREKEIVVCVVKGMTNREIAGSLFLSTHTVITHRRNIARKLQIHSASGLTIYAIVNKLVELRDLKLEKGAS